MTHLTSTLAALGADQRAILGRAFRDALARRTPTGDCDTSGVGLCTAHADDLGLCRAYRELGADLGLEAAAGREAGS